MNELKTEEKYSVVDQDTGETVYISKEEYVKLIVDMYEQGTTFLGKCKTQKESDITNDLCECGSFEEFFIKAYDYIWDLDDDYIDDLIHAIEKFYPVYGYEPLSRIREYAFEHSILYNSRVQRRNKTSESDIQKDIINNFNILFPTYDFVGVEKVLDGIGRIDIYAKEKITNRDVVIELKTNNGNPTKQLIAYGSVFENPILIGINQNGLKDNQMLNDIIYYKYDYSKHKLELISHLPVMERD